MRQLLCATCGALYDGYGTYSATAALDTMLSQADWTRIRRGIARMPPPETYFCDLCNVEIKQGETVVAVTRWWRMGPDTAEPEAWEDDYIEMPCPIKTREEAEEFAKSLAFTADRYVAEEFLHLSQMGELFDFIYGREK